MDGSESWREAGYPLTPLVCLWRKWGCHTNILFKPLDNGKIHQLMNSWIWKSSFLQQKITKDKGRKTLFFFDDNYTKFFLASVQMLFSPANCTWKHESHEIPRRLGASYRPKFSGFLSQKMVRHLICLICTRFGFTTIQFFPQTSSFKILF